MYCYRCCTKSSLLTNRPFFLFARFGGAKKWHVEFLWLPVCVCMRQDALLFRNTSKNERLRNSYIPRYTIRLISREKYCCSVARGELPGLIARPRLPAFISPAAAAEAAAAAAAAVGFRKFCSGRRQPPTYLASLLRPIQTSAMPRQE